jgi:ribosomal protein L32
MAVQKSKRYKQVVRSRRSLAKINCILKKNVSITKFKNYANISGNLKNIIYCSICRSTNLTNKLCSSCYVIYFLNFFIVKNEIRNKKYRTRNIEQERIKAYYDELSKTLFPSSRS